MYLLPPLLLSSQSPFFIPSSLSSSSSSFYLSLHLNGRGSPLQKQCPPPRTPFSVNRERQGTGVEEGRSGA